MFSMRFAVAFALLAVAAAVPTTDRPSRPTFLNPFAVIPDDEANDAPWFVFPNLGSLFAPLWQLFPSFNDIAPRIIVDDDKFQVIVHAKGYKADGLKVKTKNGFLFVQGSQAGGHDDHDAFTSQFFHTYSLPQNATVSAMTAELSTNEYLIVTAPMNGPDDKDKETDREIPVVEFGKPYVPEEKTTIAPEADDGRKEETTPSNREEVTDKENSIPHGNEAL